MTCAIILALAQLYMHDGVVQVPRAALASYSREQIADARRCLRRHGVRYRVVD